MQEQETRFRQFLQTLGEDDLDGFVVTSPANLEYLFGFTGSLGAAVVLEGSADLLVDSRYLEQAQHQATNCRVQLARDPLGQDLAARIPPQSRLGIEGDHLTFNVVCRLQHARPGLRLAADSSRLAALRSVKSPSETALIRRACLTALDAFRSILRDCRAGMSEIQLAGLVEYHCRELGSEGIPFPTIVASGPQSALPHARPTTRIYQQGENLLIDFGIRLNGYCSDLTRNVLPDVSRIQEIAEIVSDAQQAALAAIRPGVPTTAVDAAAREVITEAGYGNCFGHGTGHGIGLEVHEAPRVSFTQPAELKEGMVFTVEPGIYLPGAFGVRIEDVVAVTAAGCEILSAV